MSQQDKKDSVLDPIEDAIYDLMRGKVIIVVDDEDRENEGDFIALAERATPEVINFMITEDAAWSACRLPRNVQRNWICSRWWPRIPITTALLLPYLLTTRIPLPVFPPGKDP